MARHLVCGQSSEGTWAPLSIQGFWLASAVTPSCLPACAALLWHPLAGNHTHSSK